MATNLTIARNTIVRSTSDFVYNSVRQSILTHEFPAGSRLVEAKTSKELNVSITPVREAFARLANQGLLTVFPYKGTYVTIITKQYLEDVYFLRRHLEVMAAEKSFPKLTDKTSSIMRSCSPARTRPMTGRIYMSPSGVMYCSMSVCLPSAAVHF